MVTDVRSISQIGTTEDLDLQVSRGQIPGHSPLFKFGYNPAINNVEETIWDQGGIYAYPSSAVVMTATSASGATDAGVTILIQGLDANYLEISEEVTLDGSGTATTSQSFLRVFRAYVSGGTAPAGNITITNSAVTYARITAGENQTLMAVYTVPAGRTLYVRQGTTTHGTGTSGGVFMTVRFILRAPGGVFRTAVKLDLVESELIFPFVYPLRIGEKTDVEVRAVCNKAQDNALSATFDGVLVRHKGPL